MGPVLAGGRNEGANSGQSAEFEAPAGGILEGPGVESAKPNKNKAYPRPGKIFSPARKEKGT